MSFIPPLDQWVRLHYVDVISQTVDLIGPLAGRRILDVGCGDGLIAFGLLNGGASEVVGLDIKPLSEELIDSTVKRLADAGFPEAAQHRSRLKMVAYDGVRMPVPSDSFDVAFSWGVFEHVEDVKSVLMEMKRVMRPGGTGIIQVFPWYQSVYGSHLSDFHAPFAHLKSSESELYTEVVATLDANRDNRRDLILNHVWPEYKTLNKYSADMFYDDFRSCGFTTQKWSVIAYPQDLTDAPADLKFSDLMVCGSSVTFTK